MVISPGCQGSFRCHLVTFDYSFRLDSEVIHYEWDWDLITFLEPGEFTEMAMVVHRLKELKLQHPALYDLQYFIQLNSTRQWHCKSISFLGMGLSSIGAILVAITVVTTLGILCCKCCHNRGNSRSAVSLTSSRQPPQLRSPHPCNSAGAPPLERKAPPSHHELQERLSQVIC